jgi:hypothetical protein
MAQDQARPQSKWTDLNNDLLCVIYRKLNDIFDFMSVHAVCKSWRTTMPLHANNPPQLPYLLSDDFRLYSLGTGQTRILRAPNDQSKMFFGQSHGYLVTYERLTFTGPSKPFTSTAPILFNPFTKVQRRLPFNEFSFYSPFFIGMNALPDFDDDMVIYMKSLGRRDWLEFWHKEERKWHWVPFFEVDARTIYKKRLFYCSCRLRLTTALDLMTRNKLWDIEFPYNVNNFCCLVEADGALLGITQHAPFHTYGVWIKECSFEVYRLEEEKEPPCWVKLNNIGDQMVFLNRYEGLCLSASSFD